MRFAHARIAAITHSEIGTALAPRAHVTIRSSSNTAGATLSTPVPDELHPAHAGRVEPGDDLVPAEIAAEEHVGLRARPADRRP